MNGGKVAKWFLLGVAAIIVLGVVGFGITMIFRPFQVAEKVTDPDRALYTYEWFFNTKASVDSYAAQVKVASAAVETFKQDHVSNLESYQNSTELSRLRAVEQGLRNQLITTINQYNANAQNKSRSIFKDWNLPASLSVTQDGRVVAN
ncbi:MAG: hypothetical protein ABIG29_01220 [Candidatus Nealsonbacteria bacterium]